MISDRTIVSPADFMGTRSLRWIFAAAVLAAMAAPGTADVMADVAKYTNITPVMQISEVV